MNGLAFRPSGTTLYTPGLCFRGKGVVSISLRTWGIERLAVIWCELDILL